ncbi:uncharacterized protein LOC134822397 [Bolinopsis microptera]|uniref:uncharacterized protein LOC134822397 n=1 Tax=Bolinopsis microptera TaxID=2820187 RepID=UPI0030790062
MSKDTPSFDGTGYKRYRQLAKIWATVSTVSEEHKAMILIMFLKDKALDIALTIDEELLKTKKADAEPPETKVGVELLIAQLDEIYLESDDTLGKYERFENLKRNSEQRMTEFILIFESLERELKTEGVTLPELVLAYKLLKAANLSNADEKLARATCTAMTMEDMKKSLMRLADSQLNKSKVEESDSLPIKVKAEPCYLALDNRKLPTEAGKKETTDSNTLPEEQIMFNRNRTGNNVRGKQRPFGQRNDNRQVCYGCYSPGHWIRDCPLRAPFRQPMNFQRPPYQQHTMPNNQHSGYRQGPPNPAYYNQQIPYYLSDMIPNNEEFYGYNQEYYEEPMPTVKPIFFQWNVRQEEEAAFLAGETVNKALLDSGASRTVAGENWYSCFLDSLDDETRSTVKEFPAEIIFRFGVGTLESSKKVIIPVTICTHKIRLEVHIVNSDIPLLLSLKSMKCMGVQLNFETDTITIRGEDYKLELTKSGHYAIPIHEENVMVPKQEADKQMNSKERSQARAQETNSDHNSTLRDFNIPNLDPEEISAQVKPEIQTITRTTDQEEPQETTNNLPGGTAEPTIVEVKDTPETTIERTTEEVEQTKKPPKARKPMKKNEGLITAVIEGDTVVFQEPDSDTWHKVQLKSRGNTVNSMNKNYWNVISEDGSFSGVNLDKVDWLLEKDPPEPPPIAEPNGNEESIKFAEMMSEEVFVLRTVPSTYYN